MKGSFTRPVCETPGCGRPSRFNPYAVVRQNSRWCEPCRNRWRRWGDPRQSVLQMKALIPIVRKVLGVIERDRTTKIAAGASQLCLNLRDHVEEVLADLERGQTVWRWTDRACREILRCLRENEPVKCAAVAGALFLLRERAPRTFVSEEAWVHTFVRSWRKMLSDTAVGSYWDHREQKVHKVYKELPWQVVQNMGQLLITTFAPLGARLILLEQRRRGKLGQEAVKQSLDAGFEDLLKSKRKKGPSPNRYVPTQQHKQRMSESIKRWWSQRKLAQKKS